MKYGNTDIVNCFVGTTQITKVMYANQLIWENIKWLMDMVITNEQIADIYDFEYIFPDETDGVTTLKGVASDSAHIDFETKYEFKNISNATTADTLVTDSPITNGDNLVIVKDDHSIHELVASGISETGPYTMDTTSITSGEIPSRVFTVDAKTSLAISAGYINATILSDTYAIENEEVPAGEEIFSTKGTFAFTPQSEEVEICMIGGGASGELARDSSGAYGGKAGSVVSQSVAVEIGTDVTIVVGAGGYGQWNAIRVINPGSASKFGAISAAGATNAPYTDVLGSDINCNGTFNDGATSPLYSTYNGYAYGGEAGFANGGAGKASSTSGQSGTKGSGGGGSIEDGGSMGGTGGTGYLKVTWAATTITKLTLTRKYENLIDNIGSLTISPKVTLKSIGDKMIELNGSIMQ